jgi:hypothetical protein
MRANTGVVFVCLALMVLCVSPAEAAEVAQGKCIEYDREKMLITIEEYDINFSEQYPYGQPTGKTRVFKVSKALIGLTPELGDILRIAYKVLGAECVGLKVMNVSKQDLMKR